MQCTIQHALDGGWQAFDGLERVILLPLRDGCGRRAPAQRSTHANHTIRDIGSGVAEVTAACFRDM